METQFKVGDKIEGLADLNDTGRIVAVEPGKYRVLWKNAGFMLHDSALIETFYRLADVSGNYPCTDRIAWTEVESNTVLHRDCGKCDHCKKEIELIKEQMAQAFARKE